MSASAAATTVSEIEAAAPSGASDARAVLIGAMSDMVAERRPASAAEALRILRLAFPDYPLALRLAALAVAMRPAPASK